MGPVERSAKKDLAALPPEYRSSAIAQGYLLLARRLDQGISARDSAQLAREMRLTLLTLNDLAPAKHDSDPVDELKARRETRMTAEASAAEVAKARK